MSFVLVGTVLASYIASVFWGMGYALKSEMDSGVLESNWLTPIPRPLMLVGQTLAMLFSGPERASRIRIRYGKELRTEVLHDPERRHRDRDEHLEEGDSAKRAHPAHARHGGQEQSGDREQVQHGFETLAPMDREHG